MHRRALAPLFGAVVALGLGCSSTQEPEAASTSAALSVVPRPKHVVVVIEENHAFSEIIGNPAAPTMNALAAKGALFTNSHAVEHPSEPNYLDLFSGSDQGLHDDSCPHTFSGPNLGASLASAGLSFTGYSEGLPGVGSTVCSAGNYWRKHNPWVDFTNVATSANQPFTSFPTNNFDALPTVAFVIPDQQHDMHDGSIAQADQWLAQNIASYVSWAMANDSLLVLTWDEDDNSQSNRIPTLFVGPMVKAGTYGEGISHFSVLRTIEAMYGLAPIGQSAGAAPITDVWKGSTGTDGGVDAGPPDFQRTVVFIEAQTQPGQDMFVRGGIDFGYGATQLGRSCDASLYDCAIPIRHRNTKNFSTASKKIGDTFLDWGGAEAGQDASAMGTPMDWTTNAWPAAWGPARTVATDGYGVEPLNTWGPHEWMLDVDMDCSKTVGGWFELKSFVKNGQGWEGDVQQAGTPYASHNHFGKCGQVNRFVAGASTAEIRPF